MAWKRRSRPCLAVPPALSPSTRYSSQRLRIAFAAVGELAGQAAAVERAFAASQVAGLAGGFAGAGSLNGLVDDALGDGRILLEVATQALVDEGLHGAGDVGVELALGLAFELRLRQLDADHGHQSFAHVVAAQVFLQILEKTERLADGVDGARQRGAEAGEMRTAVDGVDVVGEAEDGFGVAVVVLQRDLDFDLVARRLPSRSACRAAPTCRD